MEENKVEEKKCCGNDKACDSCKDGSCCGHRCCGHHKCCKKIIIVIILLAIGFCIGSMACERGEFRGWKEGRFMNKSSNSEIKENGQNPNTVTGSATINVLPKTNTTTPPVIQ